jgi:hypothetical protein
MEAKDRGKFRTAEEDEVISLDDGLMKGGLHNPWRLQKSDVAVS